MSNLNFPTTGLVPNVTTYTIGTKTYVWTGVAWAIQKQNSQTIGNFTATTATISGGTISTSTSTGALTVNGGLGVSGGVNIGTTSTIGGSEIITTATVNLYARETLITAGTDTAVAITTSGNVSSIVIWNTSTLQTVTDRGNTTTNSISILNTSTATSFDSGALTVAGGVGIGGDLWVDNNIFSKTALVITTSTLYKYFHSGTDITVVVSATDLSISISDISTLQSVTDRGTTTTNIVFFANTTNSTSSSTGAVIISGGLGVAGRINSESIQIADAIMDSGQVRINTTNTTEVDSYPADQYRTAKYLIQIDEGTGAGAQFESLEIMLLVDNNQNVVATEYGAVRTSGPLGEFAADVQNDNLVRLYFTAYNPTNKILKIFRTTMTV
jgi:hypothetical protein